MTDGTGKGQGESVGMAGTKADALTVSGSVAVVRPAAMPDLAVEHAHRTCRPARRYDLRLELGARWVAR